MYDISSLSVKYVLKCFLRLSACLPQQCGRIRSDTNVPGHRTEKASFSFVVKREVSGY